MGFCLLPDYSFSKITDISPEFLKDKGIKFLMIDLDNTLAAYDEHIPCEKISNWISGIKEAGITPALVSNTRKVMRVFSFAESFDCNSVASAKKPSIMNILDLMETSNAKANESALIGDQIFTDVLAANRAKIISIIVKPRKFTNIFLALRYYAEQPIRFFARNKN
jgi:HAD superfamily phosphatase (TIGR01668 family)